MEEIWVDVRDYIGLYQVSNWGRVKSVERDVESRNRYGKCIKHLKEMILSQTLDKKGYLRVKLSKIGVPDTKRVHKLVAEAFIPNPNGYDTVHHINGDQTDNRVENLEWISKPQHDAMHTAEKAELFGKAVYQRDPKTKDIVNIWKSVREIERVLGFGHSNISRACIGGFYKKGKWINCLSAYDYGWSYSPINAKKES